MRRIVTALVALLLMVTAAPVGAEVTQDELREARDKVNEQSSALEDELARLDAILVQQAEFENRIARIQREMANRDRQIVLAGFAARDRAREMYISAGADATQAAVSPEGVARHETKTAYLGVVVDTDNDAVNELIYLQEDRASLEAQFETLAAEQEALAEEAARIAEHLTAELEQYNEEYQALYGQWQQEEAARRAEAERRRRAAAAAAAAAAAQNTAYASSAFVDPNGRTCPVVGAHTFRDSWLEPRPYRNGYHHGTDMIAAVGTPVAAMENGYVIQRGYHWAGGNGMYIRGDSGDIYYYAHLNGYAAGSEVGSRVAVKQIVAYVGNTGASSVPHLHLGYQPGGGPLTNPYQLLVALCR
ncbi:MAG TPA: peptidoglycan DD-metalloendopeptidase family protein [Acidimicrobiia bacterium]|nr:peptidoglycan DD-metalloendopeptidase family protein [Acidimicrobiia bacterium]